MPLSRRDRAAAMYPCGANCPPKNRGSCGASMTWLLFCPTHALQAHHFSGFALETGCAMLGGDSMNGTPQ